jgi:hypothetical protein
MALIALDADGRTPKDLMFASLKDRGGRGPQT